jgi:hypothetical protein
VVTSICFMLTLFALSRDQTGCSSSTKKEGNELEQSYHAIVTYVGVVYGSFSASCVELIDWTNTANYDESAELSNIIAEQWRIQGASQAAAPPPPWLDAKFFFTCSHIKQICSPSPHYIKFKISQD